MNRKLTLYYETFEEDNMTVLSVADEETDTCIFMVNNEEADELYNLITKYERNNTPTDYRPQCCIEHDVHILTCDVCEFGLGD